MQLRFVDRGSKGFDRERGFERNREVERDNMQNRAIKIPFSHHICRFLMINHHILFHVIMISC